jgi:hypothetical protein
VIVTKQPQNGVNVSVSIEDKTESPSYLHSRATFPSSFVAVRAGEAILRLRAALIVDGNLVQYDVVLHVDANIGLIIPLCNMMMEKVVWKIVYRIFLFKF